MLRNNNSSNDTLDRRISLDDFIKAIKRNDSATVNQYINENGANPIAINATNKYRNTTLYRKTPLMYAAKYGSTEVVRLL